MLSKKLAYVLFGIIFLLTTLFGYEVFQKNTKNKASEDKINLIISKFENKFKEDSIYLAKANKMLIDKISQKIIDSVSNEYEKKLALVINQNNKYKKLLVDNGVVINNNSTNKNEIKNKHNNTINVISYKDLATNSNNFKIERKNHLNVITYSKLNNNNYNHSKKAIKLNVKSYKDIEKVTNIIKPNNNLTQELLSENNTVAKTTKIIHNNYLLDNAENIYDIDKGPIYKGCENIISTKEQKKCFATKITKHILNNFNTNNIEKNKLKKGLYKVRVLFIIDKSGKAKFGKLVGKWSNDIYNEAKLAVETIPYLKPGINKNKPIPVKYSVVIPFIIN